MLYFAAVCLAIYALSTALECAAHCYGGMKQPWRRLRYFSVAAGALVFMATVAFQAGFIPESPIPQAQAKLVERHEAALLDREKTKLQDQQKLKSALLDPEHISPLAHQETKPLDRQLAKLRDQERLDAAFPAASTPRKIVVAKKEILPLKANGYEAASLSGKPGIHWYIHYYSDLYGIDPLLIKAVIRVESRFDPNARSRSGAMGLMQINKVTAKHLGLKDPFDIRENIEGGTRYLQTLLKRHYWDLHRALASYNAGPTTVARYGGIPPYPETRRYIWKVINEYRKLKLVAMAFGGLRTYRISRPADSREKKHMIEAQNVHPTLPGLGMSEKSTLHASITTPGTLDYRMN